jgi:hypothetical protein
MLILVFGERRGGGEVSRRLPLP